MKLSLTLVLLLISYSLASAQEYEYGSGSDLKGLTTYYLDTHGDLKVHDKIIGEIAKALPDLKLVDTFDEAQMKMSFQAGTDQEVSGYSDTKSGHIQTDNLPTGVGLVAIAAKGMDKSRPRIVMSFHSRQDGKLEKMPYTKFAREFIRLYRDANDLK